MSPKPSATSPPAASPARSCCCRRKREREREKDPLLACLRGKGETPSPQGPKPSSPHGGSAAMSQLKRVLLWVMAGAYILAGVGHFIWPEFYMPMMPPYLPW